MDEARASKKNLKQLEQSQRKSGRRINAHIHDLNQKFLELTENVRAEFNSGDDKSNQRYLTYIDLAQSQIAAGMSDTTKKLESSFTEFGNQVDQRLIQSDAQHAALEQQVDQRLIQLDAQNQALIQSHQHLTEDTHRALNDLYMDSQNFFNATTDREVADQLMIENNDVPDPSEQLMIEPPYFPTSISDPVMADTMIGGPVNQHHYNSLESDTGETPQQIILMTEDDISENDNGDVIAHANLMDVPRKGKFGVYREGSPTKIDVSLGRQTRSMTKQNDSPAIRQQHALMQQNHGKTAHIHSLQRAGNHQVIQGIGNEEKCKSSLHRIIRTIDDERKRLLADPRYGHLVEQAEADEIEKLRTMNVFEEIGHDEVPEKERILGTRYVHTVDDTDKKSNGKVEARCVAQGFNQDIGGEETYSPVIMPESVRIFTIATTVHRMDIKQMDVSLAYLHLPLTNPVYVRPPKGVPGVDEKKIWKCVKALYGLKNAGKAWYVTFTEKLANFGFDVTRSEHGLFTKMDGDELTMIVALYVDDLLVGIRSVEEYEVFKTYMNDIARIKIKDLGNVTEFCGVEYEKTTDGYRLHQDTYTRDLLIKNERHLTREKQKMPMNDYDRDKEADELSEKELKEYQELLGSLNWLANITRPDLAQCVSKFSSYTKGARRGDLMQLRRTLLYLRDNEFPGLIIRKSMYPNDAVKLYAFSGASFANEEGRKSRTGFIIYINGTPIFWKSKKQGLVTTSTHAAEFVALSHTVIELVWVMGLLKELGIKTVQTPKVLEDNRGVVLSVNGTGSNPSNNKHVDIREKHVQEKVKKKEIGVEFIGTQENVADALTKPLTNVPFRRHLPLLSYDTAHEIRAIKVVPYMLDLYRKPWNRLNESPDSGV